MTLHEAPPPQMSAPLTLRGSRCGLKGTIPQFHLVHRISSCFLREGLREEEEGGERWVFGSKLGKKIWGIFPLNS